VGLQLPQRLRRVGWWAITVPGVLALAACSDQTKEQWKRGGLPQGVTDETGVVTHFWQSSWVTLLIVGVLVWGLILFVVFKYRRRDDDEIPVQTRYNLPMEMLYTVAPVIVVLVFFKFVIDTQRDVQAEVPNPDHNITVVGQQWSWTFNYVKDKALDGKTTVFEPGSADDPPTLYLPVNESVRFTLRSSDVIHSFWVPAFIYKLDIIPGVPGRANTFSLTPTREGTYAGRCAELCGTYHSRMLFNVKIVSAEEYAAELQRLQNEGNVGLTVGGSEVARQAGLEGTDANRGSEE
jgi:cytochrome c oxidase subunit II